jgi:signal transduction histidine kinase
MADNTYSKQLRVGLQLKAVLILTFVVLCAALCGGWFYFDSTRQWLRAEERQGGTRLAHALSLAAQHDIQAGRFDELQTLTREYLRNDNIEFVAFLDAKGRVVAASSCDDRLGAFPDLTQLPISVSMTRWSGDNRLLLAQPVVLRDVNWFRDRLAGSVRMVIDTRGTAETLTRVRRRMSLVVACIVLCALPLGYLLVWRAIGQPVRKLVNVTRHLAEGDFSARAGFQRNDEIGELSTAFDGMADEISRARDELVLANEHLELKVAERTDELQRANGRLREEMAEKEDFLRAVSHDLNAPLRNIAGMATMVMMKYRDEVPEEVLARLQRIQANVDVETSLIAELLELSRVRSRPQRRREVDMGELMQDVKRLFEFELKSRRIALVVQEPMPTLWVEPSRLRQVFQNLVDNAIKYMDRPDGGRIEITYDGFEGFHRFSVSDNGPGIPQDQWKKIFYVFRRAAGAGKSRVEGRGVGLAMVKTVASNYEGRAWVESVVGQGSTFHVTLAPERTAPGEDSPHRQMERADARVQHHPVG